MAQFRMHGANPEKLYKSFGMDMPEQVHDFSTNTNALEWDGEIVLDMKKTLCDYPDDEASSVRKLLAEQNGCKEDEILVVNGSNEAIYLLASFQNGKKNAILQPVYGEYARALDSFNADMRNIADLRELEACDRTVWICNPCNPTGDYISSDDMKLILKTNKDKLFIIDEAYRDFLLMADEGANFRSFANAVVMRSLTKIYHLCGCRIGYVMADSAVISMLKKRQPTWSVNSLAQTAAAAFLKDVEFPKKTREYYRKEIPRFMASLIRAGCELLPTSVNYFLMKVQDDEEIIRFFLERGIVVRHTRNFPGLNGRYIRVAARTRSENDKFVQAAKEYLER